MLRWICGLAGMLLALAMLAAGCSRTPPETALRETVAALQAAIDRRDAADVQAILAADFIGPEGLDRDGARQLAQLSFMRHRDVSARLGPLDVAMQEQHATVRFSAALTGGQGVLPENVQVYDVVTGWRLVDGEWRLVNASWKPAL